LNRVICTHEVFLKSVMFAATDAEPNPALHSGLLLFVGGSDIRIRYIGSFQVSECLHRLQ